MCVNLSNLHYTAETGLNLQISVKYVCESNPLYEFDSTELKLDKMNLLVLCTKMQFLIMCCFCRHL